MGNSVPVGGLYGYEIAYQQAREGIWYSLYRYILPV